ncbi:MAG: hypothetical protein MJ014_02410 [Methanocorpusculum sp.]|nr:hypothetical protein [Methanocorpusculum sp.]
MQHSPSSSASQTAAKGDYIHNAGTASDNPAGVAVSIFDTNYYECITTPVDNGRFVPGDKNQQTSASGISSTVTVIAGNPNAWSYPVSKHSLPIH